MRPSPISSSSKSARFTQTAANGEARDIVPHLNKSTGIWGTDFDLYAIRSSVPFPISNVVRASGALEVSSTTAGT
ncbi:MAG: hypothetical protein IPJ85_16260 [Flavobacteriales bacterium]|nr:hypothetical protein [Flavobacteriales bacterium]